MSIYIKTSSGAEEISATSTSNSFDVTVVTTVDTACADYTDTGIYYFSSTYTPTDIPVGVNGWLVTLKSNSTTMKQLWFRHGTANSNSHQMYERLVTSSTTGDWVLYIDTKNLTDSITSTSTTTAATANSVYTCYTTLVDYIDEEISGGAW